MTQQHNKKATKRRIHFGTDTTLVFTILFLVVFGIIMVYSSSYYASYQRYGNHVEYLKKQALWCGIGVTCMYLVSQINYKFICKYWAVFYLGAIACLVLVLFIGKDVNGAKRWLDFKVFQFQPSEVAKLALIITLSVTISNMHQYITNIKVFIFNVLFVVAPVILILIENMSTAFVVFVIGMSMIYLAMPNIKSIIMYMVLPGTIAGTLLLVFKGLFGSVFKDYRMSRWEIFINGPWSDPQGAGYQTIQSLYAIGSGGLFGKGLGYSMQKNGFIPEAHNDIIFAIICEELGLFGATALILLFMLLIWRCMVIASNAKNLQAMLLVTGIMVQVAIQAIINIAVVTNSMPNTGMPLPFISYGGSSLLFLMIEMGIVLNVARHNRANASSVERSKD